MAISLFTPISKMLARNSLSTDYWETPLLTLPHLQNWSLRPAVSFPSLLLFLVQRLFSNHEWALFLNNLRYGSLHLEICVGYILRSSLLWERGKDVLLPMGCLVAVVSTAVCKEPRGSLWEKVCAAPSSTRTAMLCFVLLSWNAVSVASWHSKWAPAEQPTVRKTQQ